MKSSAIDRGGTHRPLVELTLARLREFIREPEALFWAFIFPILISIALAIAFPGRGSRPALVGVEAGPDRARVVQALARTSGIEVRPVEPGAELRALREGTVHLIVVPGSLPGSPPSYRFDPARDESRVARLLVDETLKRADGRVEPWTARDETVQIAGSRYVDWLIPGIIGMNIMGTGMWALGFSIVNTRMRHLLKRLSASPMRKSEYLLAQILARLVFLAPEVAVPLLFGGLVLGMPIRGSIVAIAVVTLIGALAFSALGLLAACRARTIEAISGLLNLAMLPMWILSGIFFAASNFPASVQPFIQALPLTALIDALRAVVLDGAPLTAAVVRNELLVLSAWSLLGFGAALKMFNWR